MATVPTADGEETTYGRCLCQPERVLSLNR
jgi:hypothetical protein